MQPSDRAGRLRAKAAKLLEEAERLAASPPRPTGRIFPVMMFQAVSAALGMEEASLRTAWRALREGGLEQSTTARGRGAFVTAEDAGRLVVAVLSSDTIMGVADAAKIMIPAVASNAGVFCRSTGLPCVDDRISFGESVQGLIANMCAGRLEAAEFNCRVAVNLTRQVAEMHATFRGETISLRFGAGRPSPGDREVTTVITDKALRLIAAPWAAP